MNFFMSLFNSRCYALMRIIIGFLFLCHGSQKLFGFPGTMPSGAPPFIVYGAGSIELIGGALVMVGLCTGWAAFISSGEMAVAYWMAHGLKAPLPIQNNGELAVVYCFIFLYISAHGAGIWSLDGLRGKGVAEPS